MRRVSKKRAATLAERERVRTHVLERDGGCVFWWCVFDSSQWLAGDLSLASTRCGGLEDVHPIIAAEVWPDVMTHPKHLVTLCEHHRDWVVNNPAEAMRIGLYRASWDRW